MPIAPKLSRSGRYPPFVTLAIVSLLVLFWMVQAAGTLPMAAKRDVLAFYQGARFALEGRWAGLHDAAAQLEFHRSIYPELEDATPYIRPNFYAALVAPWAAIPYPAAFRVWIAMHSLLLMGCLYWAGRRFGWDAMIWGAMYFPAFAGVLNGQDCVWILMIAIAGFTLAGRNRNLAAGAVFGLALIKFNLLVLLPLAMVASKRWRMLAGYCATAAIAGAVFLALGGLEHLGTYRDLLTNSELKWLEPHPERMINFTAIAANLGLPRFFVYCAGVIAAILALWAGRKAPLWHWLSLAMIGSVLINPHGYAYDGGMLLLPIWMILFMSGDRLSRTLAALFAVPLPFYTLLLGTPWCVLPPLILTALFGSLVRLALRPQPEPAAISQPLPAASPGHFLTR